MKIIACFAALAAVMGNCHNSAQQKMAATLSDRTIEYQSGKNEYSVVVVEMKGLTMVEAKRIAKVKAAEMAADDGYRYITFEAVQKTEVIHSNQAWPADQAHYGNLYKELILDGGFDKDRLAREKIPSEEVYSAYRFVFKGSETKASWKSIDVCTLTRCY